MLGRIADRPRKQSPQQAKRPFETLPNHNRDSAMTGRVNCIVKAPCRKPLNMAEAAIALATESL